jgi:hypothetical protein
MRDLEVIDSELRLLLAIRRMVASRRVVRSMNCSTSACSLLADRLVR